MKSLENTPTKFNIPHGFSKKVSELNEINSFNFERGLKSKDLPELYFTNLAKDQSEEEYDIVINYYFRYLNRDYSFLDEFVVDNELPFNEREERLFSIIKEIQSVKYNEKDCKKIIKLKNIYNTGLHLYLFSNHNNYSILLIDLYHLAIYGRKFVNGKEYNTPIQRLYKFRSKNTYKLDDIIELNNK